MSQKLAIVMAAGKGTRMNSEIPKVLMPVCGRPIVEFVLDAVEAAGVDRIIVVIGFRADLVREALAHRPNLVFVEQTEQLGTGHAVQVCRAHLEDWNGAVLVLTGDSPMTQPQSLRSLLQLYDREQPACILGSLMSDDPEGLGRIVRDAEGDFQAIVEHKDATSEQRQVNEVNMSTYVFEVGSLLMALDRLSNHNVQNEYYVTDCPGILKNSGQDVRALAVLKPCEALSVNSPEQLQIVEDEMRRMQCES